MTKVSVGHTPFKPVLHLTDSWINLVEESEPVVRNGMNHHASVLLTPISADEPSIDELVNEPCNVGGRIEHPFTDLTARMSIRMDPPKDPEHIVVTELEIVVLTHGLDVPPDMRGGNEQIQHRLLPLVFERSRLFEPVSKDLSHV